MAPSLTKVQQRAIEKLHTEGLSNSDFRHILYVAANTGWAAVLEEGLRLRKVNGLFLNRLLFWAARSGSDYTAAVEVLLAAGADPNFPGVLGGCAIATLPVLIRHGGDIGRPGAANPLICAIVDRTKEDKALALIELGVDPNIADDSGVTALMHAAALGRTKTFDALVEAGADLYAVDTSGRSVARHLAESFTGGTHVSTESDLKRAARIARQLRRLLPAQPEDAILLAIVLGDVDALQKMLDGGLDPNEVIPGSMGLVGVSAEQLRSRWRYFGGVVAAAVADKAFPSTADSDRTMGGMTLLMWATATRKPECVRVLLRHGADPDFVNEGGVSAISIAQWAKSGDIESLLRSGAEATDATSGDGSVPCHALGLSTSETETLLAKAEDTLKQYGLHYSGFNLECRIDYHWEVFCLQHLLGEADAGRESMEIIAAVAEELYFGPHFAERFPQSRKPLPHVQQWKEVLRWLPSFPRALAASSALGQWERVDKLMDYPDKTCPRGDRSPTSGTKWYEWPLWQHLASVARGEEPDPRWLEGMRKDSTRQSKAMLAAYDALEADNAKQLGKAIGRIIAGQLAWQHTFFKRQRPDLCVSAEATFFYHLGHKKGLTIEIPTDWRPHIFVPSSC